MQRKFIPENLQREQYEKRQQLEDQDQHQRYNFLSLEKFLKLSYLTLWCKYGRNGHLFHSMPFLHRRL